jgi:hypothetical protein
MKVKRNRGDAEPCRKERRPDCATSGPGIWEGENFLILKTVDAMLVMFFILSVICFVQEKAI